MTATRSWLPFALAIAAFISPAAAQQPNWTAETSDPNRLGWMRGSPPPPDRIITFADGRYFSFPQMRWTVCNFRDLMPTRVVSRGTGAPTPWPRAINPAIADVSFEVSGENRRMTVRESLDAAFADGFVVVHDGRIVFEHYAGCLSDGGTHGAMSMTKSMVGLLAEILIAEGRLDPAARVTAYVPELSPSAFGDATVREVMDMTTAIVFSEDYANPDADIWRHAAAGNPLPKPADYRGPRSYHEFLVTVRKDGRHGEAFGYRTPNTDVLGWIVARVGGMPVTDLLSEKIWRPMGAETDAYLSVDSTGTPFAGGGMTANLRDLARIGQLLLDEGRLGDRQILPVAVVRSIRAGGSREAFEKAGYRQLSGWSYRSMWWVTHNANGAYMARGVHGQSLYVDPAARVVIARFASHPTAGNAAIDPVTLPAYAEIVRALRR